MTERRRILVCDDEPQILRALKVVLREAGFEPVPAETVEEALDLAAVHPPDAAIVDLARPFISVIQHPVTTERDNLARDVMRALDEVRDDLAGSLVRSLPDDPGRPS